MSGWRYEVEITGDEAPFKWQVYRTGPTGSRNSLGTCHGEADTFEDACFDAAAAARAAEDLRRHTNTKETVVLFEVEDRPPLDAVLGSE